MLKSEKYRGMKINFVRKQINVFASVPKITKQYLGIGKTKKEAHDEAKNEIDKYLTKKGFIEGF